MKVGYLFAYDVPEEPGTRVWQYVRAAEGSFAPISTRLSRSFFEGDVPWPVAPDAERFAFLASFVVEVRDRKPRRVAREHYTKHRLLQNRRLDPEHWSSGQRALSQVVWSELSSDETRDRFSGRRFMALYHWHPSQADVGALVALLKARGLKAAQAAPEA